MSNHKHFLKFAKSKKGCWEVEKSLGDIRLEDDYFITKNRVVQGIIFQVKPTIGSPKILNSSNTLYYLQ